MIATRDALELAIDALVHQAMERKGANIDLLEAIERLRAINAQRGCEVFESTAPALPEFIDVIIDG